MFFFISRLCLSSFTPIVCTRVGKSCKIGNTCLAGTLKNQKVLKKLLLSLPILLLMRKNNWPPYCTFYKSPMPYSENSNVPA